MSKSKKVIIEFLEKNQPEVSTQWRERAEWRRANRSWIRRSQDIAIQMLSQMDRLHLTQRDLADRMGCSQQYVSKVLKGQENLSLETICKIEDALDLVLLVRPTRRYELQDDPDTMVADESCAY